MPIKNPDEAISFSLSMENVRKEIGREGRWWIKAEAYDPANFKDVWLVVLGNGNGECGSPHQCHIHIRRDGTIMWPFKCSDGWNCK